MLSDDVRARLEQLNRARLPDSPVVVTPRHATSKSKLADSRGVAITALNARPSLVESSGVAAGPSPIEQPVSLQPLAVEGDRSLTALLPGDEVVTSHGPHYVVRQPLVGIWPELPLHLERLAESTQPNGQRAARRSERQLLGRAFPGRTLLLDLETCGLAGSPIFLVGLIRASSEGLILDQLLARNYTEEQAILATLEQFLAQQEVLVTFNGKSFDWPLVLDRRAYHRLDAGVTRLPHVDLLLHARRRWRRQVPNCRLQTLERFLCRRLRQNDIPGHQIPAEYHRFVRTGDARSLRTIMHHNALDLVTLAQLTMRLLAEAEPAQPKS